ncbi:MAG: molybdopterin-dependent oxidoreductase [Dehalococcoidia bacterium]|nr:hypothetical protein [Chloroflexota bacterium]MBT9161518.1 hypothetical protein [Chloroflexota bacterium]
MSSRQFNFKKLCAFVGGIVFVLAVIGWGVNVAEEVPYNVENDRKIVFTGFETDKEIRVTEIREMGSVTREATKLVRGGNGLIISATGILLEDVLDNLFGKSQQDFQAIRLIAGDGYSIEVPREILRNREIILAYEIDGRPLKEKHQPLRVIIPGERAMYWVFYLIEINLIPEAEETQVNRIIILETVVARVEQHDYEHDGNVYKAVKTADLIDAFAAGNTVGTVFIKAADGLDKNETREIFLAGYLKITGEYAPRFLAPNLPRGMHVKKVLWLSYGETSFFAVERGLEVFGVIEAGEKRGLAVQEIIKATGLVASESYIFTAADGYSVEIAVADIDESIVYVTSEGELATYFAELGKRVTGLLSIEAGTR